MARTLGTVERSSSAGSRNRSMKHRSSGETGPARRAGRTTGMTAEAAENPVPRTDPLPHPTAPRPSINAATVRFLRARGFTEAEAASLAAYDLGLAPVRSGWSVHELDRLSFLRWLVEHGRLRP